MPLDPTRPLTYLVTSGRTTLQTTRSSPEFANLLKLIEAAVDAHVSLLQIREKSLSTRVLEELALKAVEVTRDSATQLLINDRFDVALATGADGIQLTEQSVPARVVRGVVGQRLLIGVSTHSLNQAVHARDGGADFVLFGPVFETGSKLVFGPPQGMGALQRVAEELKPFPVIAIGGVKEENAGRCIEVGAAGIAAISLFENPSRLGTLIANLQK